MAAAIDAEEVAEPPLDFLTLLSVGAEENVFAADGSGPTRREVGHEAQWSLSTAKFGSGVDQLRDDNLETFWQWVLNLVVSLSCTSGGFHPYLPLLFRSTTDRTGIRLTQ